MRHVRQRPDGKRLNPARVASTMDPTDVVILERETEEPREALVQFVRAANTTQWAFDDFLTLVQARTAWFDDARDVPMTHDLLARVAIEALTPDRALLVIRDTVADLEVLEGLLALDVSPAVRVDMQDCIEAVLGEMDELDKVSEAIRSARPEFASTADAMRSFAGAAATFMAVAS